MWRSADVEASLLAAAGSTTAPLRFRQRPTRAVIGTARDASVAWIVDIGAAESGRGNLLAMRLRDGRIVVEQPLGQGAGVASAAPLVQDETVTVSSCVDGKGHLERYRVTLP